MKVRATKFPAVLGTVALGAVLMVPLNSGTANARGHFGMGRGQRPSNLFGITEGSDATVSLSELDITDGVGAEPVDQFGLKMNFSNRQASETHKCDSTNDSPSFGFVVALQEGGCASDDAAAAVTIPMLPRIGSGRFKFEGVTREGVTVDATLTRLVTPANSCGEWHLVLDATPINLSAIQNNPVATTITLNDGSQGCLSATATINQ